MFKKILFSFLTLIVLVTSLEARTNEVFKKEQAENQRYNQTIRAFMKDNKKMEQLVYKAHAYIVFPSIGKGGLILGGAYGNGRAYRRGMWVGEVNMTQYTFGLQFGGQSYSEIIFFKTEKAFNAFKEVGLLSGTQSSLVGVTSGVSGDLNIASDVAVFTSANGGLMLEATTGAQDFTYKSRE